MSPYFGPSVQTVGGEMIVSDPGIFFDREQTMSRLDMTGTNLGSSSGAVYFNYYTARATRTVSTLRYLCGATVASGLTLLRYGLYSVAEDGTLTLLGATPSDTTMMAVAHTAYDKDLTDEVAMVKGDRYAFAHLTIGTTPGTRAGVLLAHFNFGKLEPRMNGQLPGQTDLPATVTPAALAANDTSAVMYAEAF